MKPAYSTCDVLRKRIIAGFEISEIRYRPDLNLPTHFHERAGFCLVLDGSYTEKYTAKTLVCKPRTVTFSPATEPHSNHFQRSGSRCVVIDISKQWLDRGRELNLALNNPNDFHGGSINWLASRLYEEFRVTDAASEITVEGLVLEMMGFASRHLTKTDERKAPPWLERAREILHAQFSHDVTLSEIATSVDIHPVYLASEFRRQFGLTIGGYVRKLRVDFACDKLLNSNLPLVDIALIAGFSDQSHFCRVFKSFTGTTPTRYRSLRLS